MDFNTAEQKKVVRVVGLPLRTSNENGRAAIEIKEHNEKFFQNHVAQKIPNKASNTLYAVYTNYEGDYTQPYTYILGYPVVNLDAIPEGMVSCTLPAGSYARVDVTGDFPQSLIHAWQEIWKVDAELSRAYTTDFEVYEENFDPLTKPELSIYLSLQEVAVS